MKKSNLSKFLEYIAGYFGRPNYVIDNSINSIDLIKILINRSFQLMRGIFYRIFVLKAGSGLFVGKGVKLKFASKLRFGKNVVLGNNVEIVGLCKNGIVFGNNVSISKDGFIECVSVLENIGEGLQIGNNVGIAQNIFIQVRGSVKIGNDVIIGPNVSIFSESHNSGNLEIPIRLQGVSRRGVIIDDGVWVGTRAIILDGVHVGKNSIIAAGSIVTQDVPNNSIVGGVPANLIMVRK
jgi:acetyltransferase-like isoleucine patch superfamily enzyme